MALPIIAWAGLALAGADWMRRRSIRNFYQGPQQRADFSKVFMPGQTGPHGEGNLPPLTLNPVPAGSLALPAGQLCAREPFAIGNLSYSRLDRPVPRGNHPVVLSMAGIPPNDLRVAAAKVVTAGPLIFSSASGKD